MATKFPGKFVWFELVGADNKKAQAFYGEVLGWKVEPFAMGDQTYDMIKPPDAAPFGGYSPEPAPGQPPHWISHLSVPDVDRALATATAKGAKVVAPAFDVPTIGRMALITDPTGAAVYLFQGAGEDSPDEPSKPGGVHWNELVTTDGARAAAFYAAVAGYEVKEMDMGPFGIYRVLEQGGVPRGGVATVPPGAPAQWLPYFHVDACDATVARARKLGAEVTQEPTDIPDIGRFATLVDPQGAAFAIVTPVAR